MAETDNLGVEGNAPIPSLNDLQSQQIGGLVSPFSIDPSSLQLPEPPRSYPVGVPSSNLIKTQPPTDGYDQKFNKIIQKFDDIKWADDTLKYSKEESYNADYDGANFERYYKTPNVFKQYGFSPYRDNEKLYNENATWFDYYKRSLGAMGSGFASGFTDMLPWNSWSSDVTDIEAARNMERAHAIGADNRGGFGSFMNNMTVDFGYTGGILAEFAAEELVMWAGAALAAPETAGGSFAAAGAEATMQAGKLGKLFKKAMDLKTYAKGLAKTQDWIRNADKLRDIYSVAKTGATKLGKALVPETLKYADEMAQLGKKGELVFDMAKTAKGFGALYRDARRVSASVSESAMEGGSAELAVRDKLADEIYATGRAPSQEEWADIYAKAADAGRETFWWNLPVLYASNAIVFEKAFKGFKPLEAFKEELSTGIKGKLTYNQAWKAAGKKAWEVVDKGFMDSVKALGDIQTYKPKNLIKSVVGKFANYTQANLAEGFQEVYQDAVQKTMTDYYTDQFYHPAVAGARSTWGAFADNAGMLNPFGESSQTFLSGFLMGSMATAPQKLAFEWIPKKFYQITDPKGFAENEANLKRHTNSVVDALNAATMDEKFFDAITVNANQQFNNKKEAELANMAGDKRAFYTITDNAVADHMHTLINTGKINLIKDHLEDLKQLTPSELQEAFGPIDKSQGDPETFYQNKIQAMMDKIDLVEKHTERIEKRFPNPFNPAGVNKKADPEGYEKEFNRYRGFELAKKAAIMSSYNFDRAVERIESISSKLLKDYDNIWKGPNMKFSQTMANVSATNLGTILNVNSIEASIALLKSEVDTYSKGDVESQKKAEASKANLEDLEDLKAAIQEVQLFSFISKEEDANPDSQKAAEAKKASKITQGTKVKNKKGETVTVAKVKGGFAYDKAGNKIGKSKNLEVIGGEQGSEDYLNTAGQNLYNAYSKYIKNVGKRAGLTVHQEAIDNTFQDYKDIFLLGADMQEYADHVDILHNPKGFINYASRASQVLGTIKEQQRELIEKAYKKFLDFKDTNDLFEQLYKKGLFLDEEGMQNIMDKKLPNSFYKISDMSTVTEGDPLVDEINTLLDQYEKAKGFTFEGRKKAEPETTEEQPAVTTTPEAPVTPQAETGPITKDTSIERLRAVGLLPSLVSAFRDFVNNAYDTGNLEILYRLNTRFGNITKEEFNKYDDNAIASMNSFKTYLSYSNPGRMMAEYNRKAGLTPTEPAAAKPAVDWSNLIDKAVSEKELDSIMDQMDKEGIMTPDFLMAINKKRDSIKSKAPVTPPVTPTPTDLEAKKDDIERINEAKELHIELFKDFTTHNLNKKLVKESLSTNALEQEKNKWNTEKEAQKAIDDEIESVSEKIEYWINKGLSADEIIKKIMPPLSYTGNPLRFMLINGKQRIISFIKARTEGKINFTLQEAHKTSEKEINAKYDAELKALEGKSTAAVSTLETEKAVYNNLVDNRVSITWDSVVYDPTSPGNKKATSGTSNIIDYAGRKIVVINVNGRNIPFYLSTGSGGKVDVTSGKWYPIFGISESGWLNKLSGKEINNYYGSDILRGISEALDKKIGDIRNDNTIPKVGVKGRHFDVINKDLNPTENELPTTRDVVNKNIKETIDFLNNAELEALESKPAEKVIEEPQEKQKEKITREQKDDLKALNFQPRDFATLSRKEAQDIIDEGLKKEERLEREEQEAIDEALKAEAEKEESTKEKENRIKQMIEDAEFLEDFTDIDAEISLILATDPFFNTSELEFLIQKRKETLAENPIFENIKVNEIIQLNNKGKYVVLKKTAKAIEVRKANDITAKSFKIYASQFDKATRKPDKLYVTMRVEPGVEIVATEPVVTPEDLNTIKENFKQGSSFTDSQELEEDIAMGKKLSAAERRNNIINNIKSCGL